MKRINFAILVLLILLFIFSCVHDMPQAEGIITIEKSTERTQNSVKNLVVFYSIKNTGKIPINRSTVSFKAVTGIETYYFSRVEETRIIPDKAAYFSVELEYYQPTEALANNGVEIISYYFE